jgi:hypothetical protein
MACSPLPAAPALPALPGGISLSPTLPTPPAPPDPGLCCKVLSIPPASGPLPFPVGTYNPAVAEVLKTIMASVEGFLDAQPFRCPRE